MGFLKKIKKKTENVADKGVDAGKDVGGHVVNAGKKGVEAGKDVAGKAVDAGKNVEKKLKK